MTAATIGFIGVVAGAFLTAWFNLRAEKNRRRAAALVAAQLIASELENAVTEIKSSLDAKPVDWWSGELLTDKWDANASALAMEVDSDLLERLAIAYAQLELWEREKPKSTRPCAKQLDELAENQRQFAGLADEVKKAVKVPITSLAAKPLAIAMGLIGLALVGLLFYAAVVPRTETTDSSIAAALEQRLPGEKEVVYCSHSADRWYCDVSYPSAPRGSCRVGGSRPHTVSLQVRRSPKASKCPCGQSCYEKFEGSFEVGEGAESKILSRTPAEIARQERTERLRQKRTKKRWRDIPAKLWPSRPLEVRPAETSYAERTVDWFQGE